MGEGGGYAAPPAPATRCPQRCVVARPRLFIFSLPQLPGLRGIFLTPEPASTCRRSRPLISPTPATALASFISLHRNYSLPPSLLHRGSCMYVACFLYSPPFIFSFYFHFLRHSFFSIFSSLHVYNFSSPFHFIPFLFLTSFPNLSHYLSHLSLQSSPLISPTCFLRLARHIPFHYFCPHHPQFYPLINCTHPTHFSPFSAIVIPGFSSQCVIYPSCCPSIWSFPYSLNPPFLIFLTH